MHFSTVLQSVNAFIYALNNIQVKLYLTDNVLNLTINKKIKSHKTF